MLPYINHPPLVQITRPDRLRLIKKNIYTSDNYQGLHLANAHTNTQKDMFSSLSERWYEVEHHLLVPHQHGVQHLVRPLVVGGESTQVRDVL